MKSNQLKTFGEYVSWIVKQYQSYQKEHQQAYPYKIIEKTNEDVLLVQVVGKNVFLKMSPREIAADDTMLRGFSPFDVRTITYLACKEHFGEKQQKASEPRGHFYRLIAQTFSRRQKKHMLMIEQLQEGQLISTSVQTVSNNPEMIDGFSARDAHKIGYAAGVESTMDEREQILPKK